jgi:hypothetical protein
VGLRSQAPAALCIILLLIVQFVIGILRLIRFYWIAIREGCCRARKARQQHLIYALAPTDSISTDFAFFLLAPKK